MKKILIGLMVLLIIFAAVNLLRFESVEKVTPVAQISAVPPSPSPLMEKVSYTASFAIYTNGTFRIFTAPMYHNLSEEVFIQSENPNIVYVEKPGITWNDFFSTLPFKLDKNCLTTGTGQTFCSGSSGTLKFYLNSTQDPAALDKAINPNDRLLVTYGNETEEQIREQFKQIPK